MYEKNMYIFRIADIHVSAAECRFQLSVRKGRSCRESEQTSDSNFTNLIVFARFADENEFVNDIYQGVSVREIIDNSYNTAYYSVGDYYRNASSDKFA